MLVIGGAVQTICYSIGMVVVVGLSIVGAAYIIQSAVSNLMAQY